MSVKDKIRKAFHRLIANDRYLLATAANERSITHRFAIYLEREFSEFNVDCEYNRDGHKPKRLDLIKSICSDDTDAVTVYPDIIVHVRGKKRNHIVIEVKTSKTDTTCLVPKACTCDRCKLRCFKHTLRYKYAFYIVFPVGTDLDNLTDDKIDKMIIPVKTPRQPPLLGSESA